MVLGGVDAGGTATKCLLLNTEGQIIAEQKGPPGNYQAGAEAAAEAIKTTLQEAMAKAGLDRIAALGIGIAGAGRRPDQAKMEESLGRLAGVDRYALTDDGEIAVLGAHGGQPGIVLIAGTGSIAYGLRRDGQKVRSGGWGALLGDEGSGYWIGLQAVRRVIRAAEGRAEQTALAQTVREELGITSLEALPALVCQNTLGRKEIAALVPAVLATARHGDPAATEIINAALEELVLLVQAVAKRMDFPVTKVAVTGGIFSDPDFSTAFKRRLAASCGLETIEPSFSPVVGGVIYGAQKAGLPLTFLGNLPQGQNSCPE